MYLTNYTVALVSDLFQIRGLGGFDRRAAYPVYWAMPLPLRDPARRAPCCVGREVVTPIEALVTAIRVPTGEGRSLSPAAVSEQLEGRLAAVGMAIRSVTGQGLDRRTEDGGRPW